MRGVVHAGPIRTDLHATIAETHDGGEGDAQEDGQSATVGTTEGSDRGHEDSEDRGRRQRQPCLTLLDASGSANPSGGPTARTPGGQVPRAVVSDQHGKLDSASVAPHQGR